MGCTIDFDPVKYIIHITKTYSMNNNRLDCEPHTLFLPYMFLNLW